MTYEVDRNKHWYTENISNYIFVQMFKTPKTRGGGDQTGPEPRSRPMLLAALIIIIISPLRTSIWPPKHAQKLTKLGTHIKLGEKFYKMKN